VNAYVAPASRVFTVAHIPSSEVAKEEDHQPETACGLVMEALDCWVPVELRPGERVCAGCTDPESSTEEQGCLL